MLSVGESLALATLFVTVVFGAFGLYNSGYRSGARSIPVPPGPNLQWGGPHGCGYGFTRVPIANWLGDGPEPVICKAVSD